MPTFPVSLPFTDSFDDNVVDWRTFTVNGTITESGGKTRLSLNGGGPSNDIADIYLNFSDFTDDLTNKLVSFETQLIGMTIAGDNEVQVWWGGLGRHSYISFFSNGHFEVRYFDPETPQTPRRFQLNIGGDPNSTPVRFRFYYNGSGQNARINVSGPGDIWIRKGYTCILYSINNGSTWIKAQNAAGPPDYPFGWGLEVIRIRHTNYATFPAVHSDWGEAIVQEVTPLETGTPPVYVWGATDGNFLGDFGTLLQSFNGGDTFTDVGKPADVDWGQVAVISETEIYVTSGDSGFGTSGNLYRWQGPQGGWWNLGDANFMNECHIVDASIDSNGNHVIAAAVLRTSFNNSLVYSLDGGLTLIHTSNFLDTTYTPGQVKVFDKEHVWVIARNGSLSTTHIANYNISTSSWSTVVNLTGSLKVDIQTGHSGRLFAYSPTEVIVVGWVGTNSTRQTAYNTGSGWARFTETGAANIFGVWGRGDWYYGISANPVRLWRLPRDISVTSWELIATETGGPTVLNRGHIWSGENNVIILGGHNTSGDISHIWRYLGTGSSLTKEFTGGADDTRGIKSFGGISLPEDDTPPAIISQNPASDATQVTLDTDIQVSFYDVDTGVDVNTIELYVDGNLAYDGATDTFQTGYDGPNSLFNTNIFDNYNTYDITVDKTTDYSSYDLAEIQLIVSDVSLNELDTTYTFRIKDTEEPIFSDVSPAPNSENVSQNTLITLNIYDKGSGVDKSGIIVVVDGQTVYDGNTDTFFSPFDVSSSITPTTVDGYDGYALSLDRNGAYKANEKITVEITAPDLEGN